MNTNFVSNHAPTRKFLLSAEPVSPGPADQERLREQVGAVRRALRVRQARVARVAAHPRRQAMLKRK